MQYSYVIESLSDNRHKVTWNDDVVAVVCGTWADAMGVGRGRARLAELEAVMNSVKSAAVSLGDAAMKSDWAISTIKGLLTGLTLPE